MTVDDLLKEFVFQDPIKSVSFGNSNPVCHAFDSKARDGHDLLIGLNSGDGNSFLQFLVANAFLIVAFTRGNKLLHLLCSTYVL